jgi:aryl-alcohol dehydrogenase-like predicted oxidoreductase
MYPSARIQVEEATPMERRMLGRTGHASTIITLGGAALRPDTPRAAEAFVHEAFARGVNHVDIAPTYGEGEAEVLLGQWLPEYRKNVFLACKTRQRTAQGAAMELTRTLRRLHTDVIDLYQLHGLDELAELDLVLSEDGALRAIRAAQDTGQIRFIGITSHNPATILRALDAFDFDTVLLPVNYGLHAHPQPSNDYAPVLALARQRNLGVIAMKTVAKGPWPSDDHTYRCWYQPFDTSREVRDAVRFTLSQAVTTAATCSDLRIAQLMLDAAEEFTPMSAEEQTRLCAAAASRIPLFPRAMR